MPSPSKSRVAVFVLAGVALLLAASAAHAQRYHGGYHGYYGGHYYPHGWYHPYGPYPYGWYRPYGLGFIGIGLYVPYYGSYAYPVAPGVVYPPPAVAYGPSGAPAADQLPAGPPATTGQQPPPDRPPPDNAAHLQLLVPETAEVLVDGTKINQTGRVREIVTPPITPGARYSYKITVRYTNAQGQPIEDTRDIHFQANDWFSIDFTRPAPPRAPAPAGPLQLQPVPSVQPPR
jgi:uncharacterized protein (TIGR03000 family)